MNIKEYISSGIIESYVLGLASEEEKSILSCVRDNNPEVDQAILEMEELMGRLAEVQAMEIPADLKTVIWDKINADQSEDSIENSREHEHPTFVEVPLKDEKIVSDFFDKKTQEKTLNSGVKKVQSRKNWAIAASVLLAVSIAGNLYLFSEKESKEADLAQLNKSKIEQNYSFDLLQNKWNLIQNPQFQTISLISPEQNSSELALVFWNKQTSEVYLSIENLPEAPSGKQYQLWALADGVPIDAGLFPIDKDLNNLTQMTKTINAQAFAITLEDLGGKPAPTMTELKVIGNI